MTRNSNLEFLKKIRRRRLETRSPEIHCLCHRRLFSFCWGWKGISMFYTYLCKLLMNQLVKINFQLGGIVKANDGQCHLDASGAYTHGEILDYPSIAQINSVVKKKAINIIFAVTDDQVPTYNSRQGRILRGSIEGSAVGLLTSDSSNIVQLVTEEYQVRDLKIH